APTDATTRRRGRTCASDRDEGRGGSKVHRAPRRKPPVLPCRDFFPPTDALGNQQMAGVKGRSGGPRKNAGGARPGAGRKPMAAAKKSANAKGSAVKVKLEGQPHGGALKRTKATPVPIPDRDMLQLLQDIALGKVEATGIQVKAAVAAVQYTHAK